MATQTGSGPEPRQRVNFSLLGFIAMAFVVVGLIGIFGTYAVPLPLERAMAREIALDDTLAAARGPNPEAALAALKPRLDDSDAVLTGGIIGIEQRVAQERTAMRARFEAQAAAAGTRLRWLISLITIMSALFVMGVLTGGSARK